MQFLVIALLVAVAVGVVAELVAACSVLTRSAPRGAGPFQIAPETSTPESVRIGETLNCRRHSGRTENDFAWAFYLRSQYAADMQAVMDSANVLSSTMWRSVRRRWTGWMSIVVILGLGLTVPFSAGAIITAGLLVAVTLPVFIVITLIRWVLVRLVRGGEALHRRRAGILAQCMNPGCYYANALPDFRCSESACARIHRDLEDSRLGLFTRRCGCGHAMPARGAVAARSEDYVGLCPRCENLLETGAGANRGLSIAIVGAPKSGKTSVLARGLRATLMAFRTSGRDYQLLNTVAEGYSSGQLYRHGGGLPTPLAMGIDPGKRTPTVLQFFDPAGSHYSSLEHVAELTYLSRIDGIVVVLRGLDLLGLRDDGRPQDDPSVDNTIDFEKIMSRLDNAGVATSKKPVAVAITGFDQLSGEHRVRIDDAASSDMVRAWLLGHQLESIVRQSELEFGEVGYFLVDTASPVSSTSPVHPGVVIRWIADQVGVPLPEPSRPAQETVASPVGAVG